jgi:transcriptional regulator with XRE-family HTH domain
MGGVEPSMRTYLSFSEALRQLMDERALSFPRLSKKIDQKLSVAYIHNLASGKSRPTKENIEVIANGLDIDPSYFKEYREHLANEKIQQNPEMVDFILANEATELSEELADLNGEQKQEVIEHIREMKAKYNAAGDR